MHFKSLVQKPDFVESFAAKPYCGATSPENLLWLVVLALVFFQMIEQPSQRERISKSVHQPARSTCVIEATRGVRRKYFWLHSPCLGVLVELFHDGSQPARLNGSVVIEQNYDGERG